MVEQHSGLRFAWLRKQADDTTTPKDSPGNQLIFLLYNLVWWIPLVLPFVTDAVSYRAGFISFGVVTFVRASVNLYRINVLPPERGDRFPLRSA